MKKLSKTYKKLRIEFSFPIEIKNANGYPTYYENHDGYWCRWEYDKNGKETYYENIYGRTEGTPRSQSCGGKVIEVDGRKYKLKEL